MWKQKLGLGTFGGNGIDNNEQIRLFKRAGFDAFFTEWSYGVPVADWVKTAKDEGMIYQSVHAPFNKSDDMWCDDAELADIAEKELLACLADCEKFEIPIMVMHTIIGFDNHNPTEIGLERFGRVIDAAEKAGVKLAFENTEGEEYLFKLFDAFGDRKNVGFCWDTGHEMCYNHSQDLLQKLGNKLIATHLNDNLGIKDFGGEITWLDDLHLLPFDGIANWQNIADRLDRHGFDDIMMFELNIKSKPARHENDSYAAMDFEIYLAEAFKRACRVASLRKR